MTIRGWITGVGWVPGVRLLRKAISSNKNGRSRGWRAECRKVRTQTYQGTEAETERKRWGETEKEREMRRDRESER